jgi:hypothetical protein
MFGVHESISPISAEEFLANTHRRGKKLYIPKFESTLYWVKDVFCLGRGLQMLFPKMPDGILTCVLKESWNYDAEWQQYLPEIL